ncbi:MAG: hypothetical protein ACFE68_07710 [Candidatus Hodarchaeota archaeon]
MSSDFDDVKKVLEEFKESVESGELSASGIKAEKKKLESEFKALKRKVYEAEAPKKILMPREEGFFSVINFFTVESLSIVLFFGFFAFILEFFELSIDIGSVYIPLALSVAPALAFAGSALSKNFYGCFVIGTLAGAGAPESWHISPLSLWVFYIPTCILIGFLAFANFGSKIVLRLAAIGCGFFGVGVVFLSYWVRNQAEDKDYKNAMKSAYNWDLGSLTLDVAFLIAVLVLCSSLLVLSTTTLKKDVEKWHTIKNMGIGFCIVPLLFILSWIFFGAKELGSSKIDRGPLGSSITGNSLNAIEDFLARKSLSKFYAFNGNIFYILSLLVIVMTIGLTLFILGESEGNIKRVNLGWLSPVFGSVIAIPLWLIFLTYEPLESKMISVYIWNIVISYGLIVFAINALLAVTIIIAYDEFVENRLKKKLSEERTG